MAKRIIDKSDPDFVNCPSTAEGEVFIEHTYANDGTFTGTVTATQEVVDEIMNLTPNERAFIGWDHGNYKAALDDIQAQGLTLRKSPPGQEHFGPNEKAELHAAMQAKGIDP